ncbi:hypothetical protein HBI81_083510 [Parastagonospora nodorum]|nr:hypothetical protein HBI10_130450 [Parastagonospora nodorum]KAH4030121.1 hypothetical protein HBI13_037130 [Parastagonospora nodorum]KAH4076540.1 hypothetical protein HBH50_007060 [Parastagonospora nodorum]KAH4095979.1 hypothetical protein HBH48_050730 [Parastagonospora nodorum]KAH4120330.1 hypothetical protein HBH47_111600 [Parastagonospora nodorum]
MELQIHVLSFCSPRMLFQMMRAWLIAGAYSGHTFIHLSFLRSIENILVECDAATERQIGPVHDGVMVIRQDRITAFWDSLSKRCPNAKRVMINSCWAPRWPDTETLPVPCIWDMLVRQAPLQINTFAFIAEKVTKNSAARPSHLLSPTQEWQRSLYQPLACGSWRYVQSGRSWKTILPPTKLFNGPVGEYMALQHKSNVVQRQQDGLWVLMIEALDRHCYHKGENKPFSCPSVNCNAYFKQAGEWSVHTAEMHYNDWIAVNRFGILPVKLKREFEQQERALKEQSTQIIQSARHIQDSRISQDGARQKEIERRWIAQLENDSTWDTGTTPRASRLWIDFVQQMSEVKAQMEREHS